MRYTVRQLNAMSKDQLHTLIDQFNMNIVVLDWQECIPESVRELWMEMAEGWLDDLFYILSDGFVGYQEREPFEVYHDLRVSGYLRELRELYPGAEPDRTIEMYVGISYGGDSGDWYVTQVDVPAWMTREQAIASGRKKVIDALEDDLVSFVGLYNYPKEGEFMPMPI